MSKHRVGKGQLADERAEHVVRLEADDAGDALGPIPVLHGPTPGRGHHGQRGIGIDGVRRAHAGEQRHIEDAVTAGVAIGQVDPVLVGPGAHGAQLAGAPDESLVEPARVTAVLGLVGGRDEIVEAEGLGEGGDHVGRGRRREHQPVARGPEIGQALGGERGHDLAECGDSPPTGGLDLFLVPALGHPGGRPHQTHGEEVLAQAVVDHVEDLVARQRAALRQHSLLHEGTVEDLARGPAQQGAVEVDEDGAFRHG